MGRDTGDWSVVCSVIIMIVVSRGVPLSFGVFVPVFEREFRTNMTLLNWIGLLPQVVCLSGMPIAMAFTKVFPRDENRWCGITAAGLYSLSCVTSSVIPGEWWLLVTYSCIMGISMALSYTACSRALVEYFSRHHKYHVLVTSMLMVGYPLASVIFNPVNACLVDQVGWRWTLRIHCGLGGVVGVICSSILTSLEHCAEDTVHLQTSEDIQTHTKSYLRELFSVETIKHRPETILWYIGSGLVFLTFHAPFVNLVYYEVSKGVLFVKAALLLTALSATECVTYVAASLVGDRLKGHLIVVNIASSASSAGLYFLWPWIDISYAMSIVIAVCLGGFMGLSIVYSYAASQEVTELPIDVAWSCTNAWNGLGVLLAPFVTGSIYDIRESYDDMFYTFGGVNVVITVLFTTIVILKKTRQEASTSSSESKLLTSQNGPDTHHYATMETADEHTKQ